MAHDRGSQPRDSCLRGSEGWDAPPATVLFLYGLRSQYRSTLYLHEHAFRLENFLLVNYGVWLNLSPSRDSARRNMAHAWTDGPPPATPTVAQRTLCAVRP